MLRADAPLPVTPSQEVQIRGVLRAVHLEDDWIEVLSDGKMVHVDGAGDMLDDVLGPMVNKNVTVRAQERTKGHAPPKLYVIDVEPGEED
jgi:hypothetical protein